MDKTLHDWLTVGIIVGPQGLNGEVRINPSSDFPERFTLPGKRWVKDPTQDQPIVVFLESGRQLPGKALYVIKLKGINTRKLAESFVGHELLVLATDRPNMAEGEFHLLDLIGIEVRVASDNQLIGHVQDLISAGNDLLEVELISDKSINKKNCRVLRGMVDLLPEHTPLWQFIESTVRVHFHRAGINEIRTPLLESTELFARGIGENTDVVNKEMYSFVDRGNRSCTLRPEGTASVVRAALQHNLLNQGSQRFWYTGPMFRYERPQAGRQRQFHQIGLEFHGYSDFRTDVEAIAIAWDLLIDLGVERLSLELNTLGSIEDRILYKKTLSTWLHDHIDQLDDDSRQRLTTNPLRILDSKVPSTKTLLENVPLLIDELSEESTDRFEKVRQSLANLGIPFIINPRLVRGLDYYNHTAFEIVSDQLGAQATVCGGGRYDGLIEQLGGSSTPAIGWALGVERLVLLLSEKHISQKDKILDFYIINKGRLAQSVALSLTQQLRRVGMTVELDSSGAAFSKQFKRANRANCLKVIVLGDDEIKKNQLRLKDLHTNLPEEIYSIETFFNQFTL